MRSLLPALVAGLAHAGSISSIEDDGAISLLQLDEQVVPESMKALSERIDGLTNALAKVYQGITGKEMEFEEREEKEEKKEEEESSGGGGGGKTNDPKVELTKIEAGWADYAKTDAPFTMFISGKNMDPKNDRIVMVEWNKKCGEGSTPEMGKGLAKIDKSAANTHKPSSFKEWTELACDGTTSGSSKLSCGKGTKDNGIFFKDDTTTKEYWFRVCVCDYSQNGSCSNWSDFNIQKDATGSSLSYAEKNKLTKMNPVN